jgi:hypothetical protein
MKPSLFAIIIGVIGFSMFKSPNHSGLAKKGPICFNKLPASPRHHNSAKAILPSEGDYVASQFSKQPASILTL